MSTIKHTSKVTQDEYTKYVIESFDIQDSEESNVEINYNLSEGKNFKWNIGVILGGSGSGKTSILKKLGTIRDIEFDSSISLISNFNFLSPKEASLLLTSIGLSSVPTWLRPFNVLSNGEQYRAKLAYLVASCKDGEVILVDEFTSVVDRDVAKAMCFSLQKYIRRLDKRIVLASCHYDILEWLMPDWICNTQKGGALEKCDYLRQGRPDIELQVSRVESDTWDIFKKHHYLTEDVNKSCKFFLFTWHKKPIGIVALLNAPRKGMPNGFSISRVVVLPDYQGLGLGSKIVEFVSGIAKNEGGKVYIKTVNPALGEYFNKSDKWRGTSTNGKGRTIKHIETDSKYNNRVTRVSYSHEYVGCDIEGYEELLLPISEMRTKQLTLV